MAVGLVELDCFQSELDHFCGDQELLEDGSLLPVLREDEELGQELEGPEVLQVELGRKAQRQGVHNNYMMSLHYK